MEEIEYSDWSKLDMRVGRIISAERVPRTEKLYKIMVDIGKEEPTQIVSSLVPFYKENDLIGKKIVVLTNLKPTKFAGEVSNGMLIAAEKEDESECVLLTPLSDIEVGTRIT